LLFGIYIKNNRVDIGRLFPFFFMWNTFSQASLFGFLLQGVLALNDSLGLNCRLFAHG